MVGLYGSGYRLPTEVRDAIVRLLRQKLPCLRIAEIVGVAEQTVRNIGLRDGLLHVKKRNRTPDNPLYDPLRDGFVQQLDLTGQFCGDPQPGRRQLVASTSSNSRGYDAAAHEEDLAAWQEHQRYRRRSSKSTRQQPLSRPPRKMASSGSITRAGKT